MKMSYILLIFCSICNIHIFSQTFQSKKYRFSITFPENQSWQKKDMNKYLPDSLRNSTNSFMFSSLVTNKTIVLKIGSFRGDINNRQNFVYSPKFQENFKRGLEDEFNNDYKTVKYRIVKEIDTTFCNCPCYEIICMTSVPSNNRLLVFTKNLNFYILNAISNDSTELVDKDIDNILSTFKFKK